MLTPDFVLTNYQIKISCKITNVVSREIISCSVYEEILPLTGHALLRARFKAEPCLFIFNNSAKRRVAIASCSSSGSFSSSAMTR
jgi:hypothetical protein